MSNMKTLKGVLFPSPGVINYPKGQQFPDEERNKIGVALVEAAMEWRDKLKEAIEKAGETHEDGFLKNVELEIEGVIYGASAFEDDEAKPIIKFIDQFFDLKWVVEEKRKLVLDASETLKKRFDDFSKEYDGGLYCPHCGDFSTVTPQMEGEICNICKKGVLRGEWRIKDDKN